MNEEILNMSGNSQHDIEAFHAAQPDNHELAVITNIECGSQGCTSLLCVAA